MDAQSAHKPVLRAEVLSLLSPADAQVIMDCTVGAGGHSEAMLAAPGCKATLIGMDMDVSALQLAKVRLKPFGERVRLFHANFADLHEVLDLVEIKEVDVMLADLGMSSMQVDDPARGMSFSASGPLDMRFNAETKRTAADLVNNLPESELADLIYQYGEERFSRRIARAIVSARCEARINDTAELAEIVRRAYPAQARRSRRGVHPATRTFQALRIAINDEIANLKSLLASIPDVLTVGGRAGVISFHSLEDRPVKHAFAELASAGVVRKLTTKPVTASEEEIFDNPRSRSAKLRVIERIK